MPALARGIQRGFRLRAAPCACFTIAMNDPLASGDLALARVALATLAVRTSAASTSAEPRRAARSRRASR